MFNDGFVRNETGYACSCGCGFDTWDVETLYVLEELRNWFGKPVHVNSGCRCHAYNEEIKKLDPDYVPNTSRSKHKEGRAVDFYVEDVNPSFVYDYLDKLYPNKYGIGRYLTFTHLDTRSERARW